MAKMVHISVRSRYRLLLVLIAALFAYSFSPPTSRWSITASSAVQWSRNHIISASIRSRANSRDPQLPAADTPGSGFGPIQVPLESLEKDFFTWAGPGHPVRPKPPYKPPRAPSPPVPDPFPLLSRNPAPRPGQLRAPEANRPPRRHVPEQTPLYVGFTRNWPQLLQCVVSYIAAGWPAEDIYVFENTGVMFANRDGRLTLQNPFYLNHTQLGMLGVKVMITPTLLTFSQLQNFYLWTALTLSHPYYFWTHQDVLVLSPPPGSTQPTLYRQCLSVLRYLSAPARTGAPRWAHHFFAYDHLALVHRDAVLAVGGWDTHIPFYASDCDAYARIMWAGYWQGQQTGLGAGGGGRGTEHGDGDGGENGAVILDVSTVLEDLGALLGVQGVRARVRGIDDVVDGVAGNGTAGRDGKEGGKDEEGVDDDYVETHDRLLKLGYKMQNLKYAGGNGLRNSWQTRQTGGQGEPFYRDPDGFETGVRMMIDTGRAVFAEKWGHRGCDIVKMGIKAEDAWRLERDWDEETEGTGAEGDSW